jgi:hypothetical protein
MNILSNIIVLLLMFALISDDALSASILDWSRLGVPANSRSTAVNSGSIPITSPSASSGSSNAGKVHLNKTNLPNECSTCHYKANLKSGGGAIGCLTCHGETQRRIGNAKMPAGSVSQQGNLVNIEAEFFKTYRHPTLDDMGRHRAHETLPEIDPKAPRHADCVDCHHPHQVRKDNRFAGIVVNRNGNVQSIAPKEYEVCYLCHAESANLPGRYTNKRNEFSLNNHSYHPVEGEGRNSTVVSLIRPYREKKVNQNDISIISCSDCHGNDDVAGPKGVHGSRYQYILVENFFAGDNVTESQQAYALCYRCHNRTSILGNESFRFHAQHIVGTSTGQQGTSCYTCHNSHGSVENKYLIKFNTAVVSPSSSGYLKFVEKGSAKFSGECYLSCHGVDHNPKSY